MSELKLEDKFPKPLCKRCQGAGHCFMPKPGSVGWRDMRDGPCPDCAGTGMQVKPADGHEGHGSSVQ